MTDKDIIRDEIVWRMEAIKPNIMEREGPLIAYTAYSKIRNFIDSMIPQPTNEELANIHVEEMVGEYCEKCEGWNEYEDILRIFAYRQGIEDTLEKLRSNLTN